MVKFRIFEILVLIVVVGMFCLFYMDVIVLLKVKIPLSHRRLMSLMETYI